MRSFLKRSHVSMMALLSLLSACASIPEGVIEGSSAPDPVPPVVVSNLPQAFSSSVNDQTSMQPYAPAQWWRVFQDRNLEDLLNQTLSDNFDLAEASARLRAAQAQARLSKSGQSAQLNAAFSGGYTDTPTGATGAGQDDRSGVTAYAPSLAASYELDLWGRLENLSKASQADAYAAQADLEASRLSIIAQTIEAYFELVDTRRQTALLKKGITTLEDRVKLTESRYRQGLVSSFELYKIRQDLRSTQAAIPENEVRLAEIEGRLAILSGGYSHEMSALLKTDLTPRLAFDDIVSGAPTEILLQRPDVFAASARMEAARLRVGARRAEQFPALSLTGGVGTQDDKIAGVFDIFDNWVANLGVGLTAPLFQGGRIKANIEIADAAYAGATAAYARTVLTSYEEVNIAAKAYDAQRQRYAFLYKQLAEAKNTVNLQSNRFTSGLGDYAAYLDATLQQYQIEASVSGAARDVALSRLAIHRALGGDWTNVKATRHKTSERPISGDS